MILIEEEIFYKSFVKLILFSYLVILIEEEIFNKCHLNIGNLYIAYVQQPCCALGRWWYKKKIPVQNHAHLSFSSCGS